MKKFFAVLVAMIMLTTMGYAASPAELLEEAWNAGRTQTVNVSLDVSDELMAMVGDEMEATIAGDLLDAIALTFVGGQQGPWKAALNLSGNEVLNLLGETVDGVHHVGSTLLGEDVLAANEEELIVIANFLVQSMADEGMITEEDAQMLQMLLMMLPDMVDELAAQLPEEETEIDATPVLTLVEQWKSKATPVAQLTDMEDLCDTPASGLEFVLDKDDLLAMLDAYLEVLRNVPGFLEGMSAAMEGEDPEAALAELRDELAEELEDTEIKMLMTILYDAEEQPVYVNMTMESDEMYEGTPVSVVYARQTLEDGVEHFAMMTMDDGDDAVDLMVEVLTGRATEDRMNIIMEMKEDGEPAGLLQISWQMNKEYEAQNATEDGVFAVVIADVEGEVMGNFGLIINVDAAKTGDDVDCDTEIELILDDVTLCTLYVDTQTGDPLPSLAEGNVVRLGQMISAADLDNPQDPLYAYFETMGMNAMMNLLSMLQSLPASVLSLLME